MKFLLYKVDQLFLDETADENLNIEATQTKRKQILWRGNFTITGHREYGDGRHFSNSAEVLIGGEAYLHTKDKTFVYEIVSSKVIKATDVQVLDG